MKIIYRGGYDTKEAEKSFFYEYAEAIKRYMDSGKKVVFVTFARPDHHYDKKMLEAYGKLPEVIDNGTKLPIDWEKYDLIIMPGGNTKDLKEALVRIDFNLDKVRKDAILLGDSAGAYMLSKHYAGRKESSTEESHEYYIENGLYPESNLFTICHIDNPRHVNEEKLEMARKINEKLGTKLLLLKENESKLLENDQIKDFSIAEVLAIK